jgi:hypothetical protein
MISNLLRLGGKQLIFAGSALLLAESVSLMDVGISYTCKSPA